MIARIWRGEALAKNAPAYQRHVSETVFPALLPMHGQRGAYLLRRAAGDAVEFLAVTLWDSIDDVRQFAGDNIEEAKLEPRALEILSSYDTFARHFEVAHVSGELNDPPNKGATAWRNFS
jgi:heme-degrading monooxygenase HmoA